MYANAIIMLNFQLESKLIGEIKGDFYITHYQRGYRWGKNEVTLLLNDIFNSAGNPYCLQPIVVRKNSETEYEVIDGQQRLTTIYLIYKFLNLKSNNFIKEAKFTLDYQTRKASTDFLKNMDLSRREENIDFFFMANAYEQIEKYFEKFGDKATSQMTKLNEYFDESVSVIWYEISAEEDGSSLFTRLNIGKIPLTNSELVKALFLRSDGTEEIANRKEEISLQWDNIEKELHNPELWSFLTNASADAYPTRIDLLLDLIAEKPADTKEAYYTFFCFDEMRKKDNSLYKTWQHIQQSFLLLQDWQKEHDLYHKIGYLIASKSQTLADIFRAAQGKRKQEFKTYLDDCIRESIKLPKELELKDLSYNNHYNLIHCILLLFNVESVRTIDNYSHRFPFDVHKQSKRWSLEHVHAQNSVNLRTNEERLLWLYQHKKSLETIPHELLSGEQQTQYNKLLEDIKSLIIDIEANPKSFNVGERFQPIMAQAFALLSSANNISGEYKDSLSNMALLSIGDNSALNNSVFDVKRRLVIEMDKQGKYIPFCTKMVFFKYYSKADNSQLYFWGEQDRQDYFNAIQAKIKQYL